MAGATWLSTSGIAEGPEKEWEKTVKGASVEGSSRAQFLTVSSVELCGRYRASGLAGTERGRLRVALVAVPAGGEPRLYGPEDLGLPVHRDTVATWIKASKGGIVAISTHEQNGEPTGRLLVLRTTSTGGDGRIAEHTARSPLYSLTWAPGSIVLNKRQPAYRGVPARTRAKPVPPSRCEAPGQAAKRPREEP